MQVLVISSSTAMLKIMYDIYPAKEFLRFNVDFNSCQFCHNDLETAEHAFLHLWYGSYVDLKLTM